MGFINPGYRSVRNDRGISRSVYLWNLLFGFLNIDRLILGRQVHG